MERMRETLRALLRRALSERGRDTPGISDVLIEISHGSLQPRLGILFADGYRAWTTLSPSDCYDFCERHLAWDLERLHRVLLLEAHQVYSAMLETQRGPQRDAAAQPPRTLTERLQQLGAAIAQAWRPRWGNAFLTRVDRGLFAPDGYNAAEERGLRLLKENLNEAQLEQYQRHQYFDVIGGQTGRRYRIRYGRSMNIDQLDKRGRRICGWCFFPEGRLVAGDVMLAQKLALELFESDTIEVANRL